MKGVGGNSTRVNLRIDGNLSSEDLAALNSTEVTPLGTFTSLDLQNAVIPDIASLSGMNLGSMQHLLLPCGFESDANAFKSIKTSTNNTSLKLVASTDAITNAQEIAIYSFEANNVNTALGYQGSLMHQAGSDPHSSVPVLLNTVETVRMAGVFGDKDLSSSYNSDKLFGADPAVWDFTGADFTPCTLSSFGFADGATHYAVTDPFTDNNTGITGLTNYDTNSFCYFCVYAAKVVDITLPTEIDELPPGSLSYLASNNKDNYKLVHGLTDAQFNSQFSYQDQNGQTQVRNNVPMETLTIPNNYSILDYECALRPNIEHIIVGNGVKEIRGGAFANSTTLQDLDFASGISNCWIGDIAFGESHSMKHIALSEGIVSLGKGAFGNSQHLESIRLPSTLRFIGDEAFWNCLALNSITIPENVEQIGRRAFVGCPFTDIYLTATDPAQIPVVWSAGTGFGETDAAFDGNCSFNHGHLDGWEGGLQESHKAQVQTMTFDEAAEIYFMHWNGMPVLHYTEQLRDKVRASISSTYAMKSTDQLGLPDRQDMIKRSNIAGADLGTKGAGKWTQDGWAQFMLMKEFTTDPGGDVYQKEFEDVWYTICYPFDLTDEQLAAAFNETFNIVDFSGVEVMAADDPNNTTGMQTLTLHFNTVAKTYYRDNEGNEYEVIGREKDPGSGFNYNIYRRDGVVYHHSQVSDFLSSNKTKTFAPGGSISESNANKAKAIIIDGYLATAGHPYMVHPAIGTSLGNPKKCTFSGIEWKPQTQWPTIYEAQKRVVDLGVERGTITDDIKTCVPDADNYLQAAYGDYVGQTYTFIGNAEQYVPEAQSEIGDEPELPGIEPVERQKPSEAEVEALKPEGEPLAAPSPVVQNPDENSKYSEDFKELFKTVRCSYTGWHAETQDQNHLYEFTYGEDLANYSFDEFMEFREWHNNVQVNAYFYKTQASQHNSAVVQNIEALKAILGDEPVASRDGFDNLKQLVADYTADKEAYASYKVLWDAYIENRAAWAIYNSRRAELDTWKQEDVHQAWLEEHAAWQAKKDAHDAWVENAQSYQKLIPTGAYFLGRKGTAYPKFYREIASDERPYNERKGGFWTQYTAVIIPNDAAINGLETSLGAGSAADSKGLDMVFDEGFMGFYEPTEIKEIVDEAKEKGQDVKYVDIVVSINGQVVRRGSTSLEGLPTGLYIVNGKKYYVK